MENREDKSTNKYAGIIGMVASFVTILVLITSVISNNFEDEIIKLDRKFEKIEIQLKERKNDFLEELDIERTETDKDIQSINEKLIIINEYLKDNNGRNARQDSHIEELFRKQNKDIRIK